MFPFNYLIATIPLGDIKMNQSTSNLTQELETAGISALAATSKTPFKTAFAITLGIGLARASLFLGVITFVTVLFVIAYKLVS